MLSEAVGAAPSGSWASNTLRSLLLPSQCDCCAYKQVRISGCDLQAVCSVQYAVLLLHPITSGTMSGSSLCLVVIVSSPFLQTWPVRVPCVFMIKEGTGPGLAATRHGGHDWASRRPYCKCDVFPCALEEFGMGRFFGVSLFVGSGGARGMRSGQASCLNQRIRAASCGQVPPETSTFSLSALSNVQTSPQLGRMRGISSRRVRSETFLVDSKHSPRLKDYPCAR